MNEFLSFRKMITPMVIQILFWIGVAASVIGGIVIMSQGGVLIVAGFLYLLIGPIVVRIYCELLMIIFCMYDELKAIRVAVAPPIPTAQHAFPVAPVTPPAQ